MYIYVFFFGWVGRSFAEEYDKKRKRAGLVHLDRYVAKKGMKKMRQRDWE